MSFDKAIKYLKRHLPITSKVTGIIYDDTDYSITMEEILGEWEVNIAVEEDKPTMFIELFTRKLAEVVW